MGTSAGKRRQAGMEEKRGGGGEERGSNLAADLSSILNNPDFGDVVLVSKEGDRIPACRTLLAARSRLFHHLLINGLHLRNSPDIPLPSIRTCALLPSLDYIYTGTLSTQELTLHNVVDIIHASRYFLLPQLHSLALSFFYRQMQRPDFATHQLPMLLSRAVELLNPASEKEVFSQLVENLAAVSVHCLDNVTDFSREALCFYLEETRNPTSRILVSGYSRLALVLMWCAHLTSSVAGEAMKDYLPALQAISSSSSFHAMQKVACLETLKACQGGLQACFEPWLHRLDIFQVHPQILADVIEPLGIIQPFHLLHIYGLQAVVSKDTTLLQRKHRGSSQFYEEACVFRCSSSSFATTESPITSKMGLFEWDFVIEKSCPSLGIGICSIPAHTPAEVKGSWLGSKPYGWVLGSTGEIFHDAKGSQERKWYAPAFGDGSRIRVHLDMTKGTCSFTVNGQACGVAWTDIPPKVYPAVAMLNSGASSVRLEVARDEYKRTLLELLQPLDKNASNVPTCTDKEERESIMEVNGREGGEEGGQMGSDLAMDLGNALNDSAFGDLLLVSKEGDHFWACRILLAARSRVFECMLLNGVTLETHSSHVSLPSIHTCALVCVLEYIYTGSLSKCCLTLDNALDVVHAARYLLLTQLENVALSFFFKHSHSLCYPTHDLASGLSRALENLSLDSDTWVFLAYVNAIRQFPQVLDNPAEFSYEALCLFLHKTQTKGIGVSAFEYTRLRCALMWCAHSVSILAEKTLRMYLPAQQSDLLSSSFDAWRTTRLGVLENMVMFQGSLKDRLKPLLQYLDLFKIVPEIVLRVLEPMGIVHPPYLLHILRFQAVFSQRMNLLRWEDGAHPYYFAICEDGCVLENTSKKNWFGFATTKLPITSSTGISEWDIVVERTCPHLGIGFCSTEALLHASNEYAWLGYKEYGWILCCTGSLFHNVKPGEKGIVDYAPKFGNGDLIRVHIDWTRCECSFSVNGVACGVAWTHIPQEVYPTVTMQSPGKVRLQAVGDEEKERLLTSLRLTGA